VWLVPLGGGGARIAQPSIQAAVDVAAGGDTVLLSDGVFRGAGNRDVHVTGKNLILRSQNGPDSCVVDCQGLGRGFFFDGPLVTEDTFLCGVTITRGEVPMTTGGGVLVQNGAHPMLEGCVIDSCVRSGVFYSYSNQNGLLPLGIVRGCLFTNNSTNGDGGGFWGGASLVDGCTFIGNTAGSFGGAARTTNTMRDCLIVGNSVTNSISGGGGVFAGVDARIENCTFVGNTALNNGGVGGGLILAVGTTVVSNCIFWGNAATLCGQQVFQAGPTPGTTATVLRYCDIEGGENGVETSFLLSNTPVLENCLDLDPLFADETVGDYHLQAGSPCIDAGDPAFVVAPGQGDIDRQPRLSAARLDLGSDERWSGATLGLVAPGRAGETNTTELTGAAPGSLASFFVGSTPGAFDLSFGACPNLTLGLEDPSFLATLPVSPQGNATYSQPVPASAAGQSIFLQAVTLDTRAGSISCELTNVLAHTYP